MTILECSKDTTPHNFEVKSSSFHGTYLLCQYCGVFVSQEDIGKEEPMTVEQWNSFYMERVNGLA